MKQPVRFTFFILGLSFFITLSSCSDDKDDAPYPSIVTDMVDCPTDDEGKMKEIVLDDDTHLTLTNPQSGLKENVIYRCLAGYTLSGTSATLYQLKGATLLYDSTRKARTDPTNVVSLWRTPRYLNLHLLPKTQGGRQYWGFITDSIVNRHAYLRLHPVQGDDPTAYSTDVYASLYLKDIAADTLTLRIQTFAGWREWTL